MAPSAAIALLYLLQPFKSPGLRSCWNENDIAVIHVWTTRYLWIICGLFIGESLIKILFSGGFPKPLSNYQSSVSAHTSPVHQLTPQLGPRLVLCCVTTLHSNQLGTKFVRLHAYSLQRGSKYSIRHQVSGNISNAPHFSVHFSIGKRVWLPLQYFFQYIFRRLGASDIFV